MHMQRQTMDAGPQDLLQPLTRSDTESSAAPSDTGREECSPEALFDLIYLLFQQGTLDVKDLSRLACVANPMRNFIDSFLGYGAVLCYRVDLVREHLKALDARRRRLEGLFHMDLLIKGNRKEMLNQILDGIRRMTNDEAGEKLKRNVEKARDDYRIIRENVKRIMNLAEDIPPLLAPVDEEMLRDRSALLQASWMETESRFKGRYEKVVLGFKEVASANERALADMEGCYHGM